MKNKFTPNGLHCSLKRTRIPWILFFIFFINSINAQTALPITFSWNKEVGCQVYGDRDDTGSFFVEDVEPKECTKVCEYSYVTYTLSNLPTGSTVVWNVVGATNFSTSNTGTSANCNVSWGAAPSSGFVNFDITIGNVTISKSYEFCTIAKPQAKFEVAPVGYYDPGNIVVCTNQNISFVNLSTPLNEIVSYEWVVTDSNANIIDTSVAQSPIFSFPTSGDYDVTLTVKNKCNCTDEFRLRVYATRDGIDISCPTVVCENQSSIYSLPFNPHDFCGNPYWIVEGGEIINDMGQNIEVIWNDTAVIAANNGFGYLTFVPDGCDIECMEPSTVMIPIVQTNGTIQGPTSICVGESVRYTLPRWPATHFAWDVIGNNDPNTNTLCNLVYTDQSNEVVIVPTADAVGLGPIVLRANYTNTLLHCSGEAEIVINVGNPLTINGPQLLCDDTNGVYTVTDVNGNLVAVDWKVKKINGSTANYYNTSSINHLFTQDGDYRIEIATSNPAFCGADALSVKILADPTFGSNENISGDLLVCASNVYTYSITNPDPAFDYVWEVSDVTNTIQGYSTGEQVNIVFTTLPATVRVYKQSLSPVVCISEPKEIQIEAIPVNFEIGGEEAVCVNTSETYQALHPSSTSLYEEGDTYTWSFANSNHATIAATELGSIVSGQGTEGVEIDWHNVTQVTTLDLVLTVTKCNSQFVEVKQITLNPQLQIEITGPNEVCGGVPATFYANSAIAGMTLGSDAQYYWSVDGGAAQTITGTNSFSPTFINTGTQNVTHRVSCQVYSLDSCGVSTIFHFYVSVLPNPPVGITLSSTVNTFCNAADINATIDISTSIGSQQVIWKKNGVTLQTQPVPNTSLTVTSSPSLGFGVYTVDVYNANGCIATSNPIAILQSCPTVGCGTTETITNTSYYSGCGTITLDGNATGTPANVDWSALVTGSPNFTISGNTLTGPPGNYTIAYTANYPCPTGGYAAIQSVVNVVIPYEPDFNYITECGSNNVFNVTFVDNSEFYSLVDNRSVVFAYQPIISGIPGSISTLPVGSTSISLAAGEYNFMVTISGDLGSNPQGNCIKEISNVVLEGIDSSLQIVVNGYNDVQCHDSKVPFTINPQLPPVGYTYLWSFGDDAESTLDEPQRVYASSGTQEVTCTITNELGCDITLTAEVEIPAPCFQGDIAYVGSNGTACNGDLIELHYVPSLEDACGAVSYTWMNGKVDLGTTSTNSFMVGTTGYYWVKVTSLNGCIYNTPTQLHPIFNTLPTVKLTGETIYCGGTPVLLSLQTNASEIRWVIDGIPATQYNNQTTISIVGLAAGNHSVSVEVISLDGCTSEATHNFTIVAPPAGLSVAAVDYNCDPYQFVLQATVTSGDPNLVTYNWSNGASGSTITVTQGGPIAVTASVGSCSVTTQVDIPKNPEEFIWVFPTGCFTDCEEDQQANHLSGIGYLESFDFTWNIDGSPTSLPIQNAITGDGSHSFTLGTGLGASATPPNGLNLEEIYCTATSDPLEYTTTMCRTCTIENMGEHVIPTSATPYCSYTYTIDIDTNSFSGSQLSVSAIGNAAVIPSVFTIVPNSGIITLTFTLIPDFTTIGPSPYSGGVITLIFQGSTLVDDTYEYCTFTLPVEVPECSEAGLGTRISDGTTTPSVGAARNGIVDGAQTLMLYPNPAHHSVSLTYDLTVSDASVTVYDISGRQIQQNMLYSNSGTLQLDTSGYQAGLYIVVVRQGDTLLWQHKLIIE